MLQGLLLEYAYDAIDLGSGELHLCQTCHGTLKDHALPKLSLANGLWRGPSVPALTGLTWAERRLISLFRTSLTILHLQGFHRVQAGSLSSQRGVDQQRRLKGSFFCRYWSVSTQSLALYRCASKYALRSGLSEHGKEGSSSSACRRVGRCAAGVHNCCALIFGLYVRYNSSGQGARCQTRPSSVFY